LAKDCTELGSDEGVDEDVLTFELVFTKAVQTCPCALKPIGAILFSGQSLSPAGHSSGARTW